MALPRGLDALDGEFAHTRSNMMRPNDAGYRIYPHLATRGNYCLRYLDRAYVKLQLFDDIKEIKTNDSHSAGWLLDAGKAIATISNDLPWPTAEEFLGMIGEGQWNSVTWIESQLRDRGYLDIKVNAVTKYNSFPVAEFVEMTMFMMPLVMKCCWSEGAQEENKDKVKPALEKYLASVYGENGEVPGEWVAILSTAQKPVAGEALEDKATC